MSREALASCRTALELIAEVTSEPVVKSLAAKALAGLAEMARREDDRRSREAERKRAYRGGRPPDVPRTGADVRGTDWDGQGRTRGGVGGDLSRDPEEERDIRPQVGDPGEGPRPSSDVPGTQRRAVRATDDGCLGMALQAWVAGVVDVTRRPFTMARGVENGIVDAIVAHCPNIDRREAWARENGRAWARQRVEAGRPLKALDFPEWAATPAEARSGTYRRAIPDEGPSNAERGAERRRAQERQEREARARGEA